LALVGRAVFSGTSGRVHQTGRRRHSRERPDDLEWPDHHEPEREDLAWRERVGWIRL